MLECVINISEGTNQSTLNALARSAGADLLDIHSDRHHNRTVFTMAGEEVFAAAQRLAVSAVELIDINKHEGVHPRIGAVDVVPFVPLSGSLMKDAVSARDRFAIWMTRELHVPCYIYGEERTLPDVRKMAKANQLPVHRTAGACAVGARDVLIAYNLWLSNSDLDHAKKTAASIRRPGLRALGLQVGQAVQVSCNLTDLSKVSIHDAYDLVTQRATVARAELVGLIPDTVLHATPEDRWDQLDIGPSKTIEARQNGGLQ